ncbi:putative heme/steroid binding protein [Corynebacterium mustelae]|uniref:Putative heme/steroid binding protein n=1 Tax=Corynebacterium mustelae TaxID=571915 RepID=A0A0G3GX73_9CORY|nr:cytochrome b5 domain-containing protein [Corynebacterium mustelae]AKK05764.1 putative heme/steroid binding protein [Corynebacterium mustelae]
MPRTIVIGLIVALALAAVVCIAYFVLAPTQAGNVEKFDRTFSVSETTLIESRTVTREELEKADGKDGRPAYIAIDGVVYDVSSVESWAGGVHHNVLAGRDLTDEFLKSGHGVRHLQKLAVVGGLEGASEH